MAKRKYHKTAAFFRYQGKRIAKSKKMKRFK